MPGEYVMISYGSYAIVDEGNGESQYEQNYNIDYPIYGRSYNGTLWEKIYYEPTEQDIQDLIDSGYEVGTGEGGVGFEEITDTNGVTYLLSGRETIFYSRDYGLGYKLITSMSGNTPKVSIVDPTIVLGPLEDPTVNVDITDVNNPEIQFSLPRAVKFFYGSGLDFVIDPTVDKQYIVQYEDINVNMRLGDYYINRNTGFIFLLEAVQENNYTFTFKACFQPPAPTSVHEIGDAYYQNESGSWVSNYPRITFKKITGGWQANIISPAVPNFVIGEVNYMGPLEEGSISGSPINGTDYQFNFNIPGGPQFFTGDIIEGSDTVTAIVADARPGDIYINTNMDSDYNGNLYRYEGNSQWTNLGSIKGATGDALKIKASYSLSAANVTNDTLSEVSQYLEAQYQLSLTNDEIAFVTYTNFEGIDTSYWYFQVDGKWGRARITGGMNEIIRDQYVDNSEDGLVYSTSYINNLIVDADTATSYNPDRNTYNISTINELLDQATIKWNDFW